MLYDILTIVNILGSVATIFCLVRVIYRYQVGPRLGFYVYMNVLSMALLLFGQLYTIASPGTNWIVKIPVLYWWMKTLYFAWAVRFSSIKKS